VTPPPLNRRRFLQSVAAGGAGLTLTFCSPWDPTEDRPPSDAPFAPDAFLRLSVTGTLTIVLGQSELGQGVHTALAMIVAEELDADWTRVEIETAPAHGAYANPLMETQRTAWSASVRGWWPTLRRTGARARAMLVAEAAQQWRVPEDECNTIAGVVFHPDGIRQISYGELADSAGRRSPPRRVRLKSPDEFRLIGTSPQRLDLSAKADGSTVYGVDVRRPGMLTASVAHAPTLGSAPVRVDDTAALDLPGVRQVLRLPQAVAVLADTWWEAERGRQTLAVEWSEPEQTADSDFIQATLTDALDTKGTVTRSRGRATRALDRAASRLDARYDTPYLAHAAMEPMNCVADVRDGRCEVWVPTQNQAGALVTAARVAQLPQDRVAIHTTMVGGGFGRRLEQDFVEEAVALSRMAGAPVKVVWTREDDLLHDVFKPMTAHTIEGGLDGDGRLSAWHHQIAGGFSTDGAHDMAYGIRNMRVEYRRPASAIREGLWRSVDFLHNCFVVESFVDELANLAGTDPYRFRRDLLGDAPRHRAVLDRVTEMSNWEASKPGVARGLALTASHGSVVGQVVELSVVEGAVRVHRIVAVVDCGIVVHPDNARAQIEGAVAMGLSAALMEKVTFEGGQIDARNFDRYRLLRLPEMPRVDVHFMPSDDAPGGIGEVGVPPVAPAIGNAIFQATGRRIRRLPYLSGGRIKGL